MLIPDVPTKVIKAEKKRSIVIKKAKEFIESVKGFKMNYEELVS